MGLGSFPETHSLSLGMLGMHGTAYANYAISNADLIIALGVRFDDRITGKLDEFALKAKIIHIDIDPAEVGKNTLVNIPIIGDIKNILEKLNKYVLKKEETEWLNTIKDFKRKYPLKYINNEELKPQYIMETISKIAVWGNTRCGLLSIISILNLAVLFPREDWGQWDMVFLLLLVQR
jgi:acetolactate synthase-1/2/3 large subunit